MWTPCSGPGHFTRQEEKAAVGMSEKGSYESKLHWGVVGRVPAFSLPMTGLASVTEAPATPSSTT